MIPPSTCSCTNTQQDSTDPQSQTLDNTYDDNSELTAETEEDSVALTVRVGSMHHYLSLFVYICSSLFTSYRQIYATTAYLSV